MWFMRLIASALPNRRKMFGKYFGFLETFFLFFRALRAETNLKFRKPKKK